MKKPNLIIGKRQLILAGMTLALGIAVYTNYAVASAGKGIKTTGTVENQSINYGDAELVSTEPDKTAAKTTDTVDYFAQARIDRMNSRDQAAETLKSIIGGGDATEEEIAAATETAATLTGLMESESKIENLVKAEGFADCVCYLDGESADIVVKSGEGGLIASEDAQIKDILLSEVTVPAENIRIFDVE